jgi:hypothetical protein
MLICIDGLCRLAFHTNIPNLDTSKSLPTVFIISRANWVLRGWKTLILGLS